MVQNQQQEASNKDNLCNSISLVAQLCTPHFTRISPISARRNPEFPSRAQPLADAQEHRTHSCRQLFHHGRRLVAVFWVDVCVRSGSFLTQCAHQFRSSACIAVHSEASVQTKEKRLRLQLLSCDVAVLQMRLQCSHEARRALRLDLAQEQISVVAPLAHHVQEQLQRFNQHLWTFTQANSRSSQSIR